MSRIRGTATAMVVVMTSALYATTAVAQAGDVVMRRPIPRSSVGSEQTSTIPGAESPEDVPYTVPPDPAEQVCDQTSGSADVKVTAVKWVENGWTNGGMNEQSCSVQKMAYLCQATYECNVEGQRSSFVSVAPDSTCEGFKGEVAYPGGVPDPTKFPADRSVDDQVKWFAAKVNNVVSQQQSGGASATDSPVIRAVPWVRGVDQIRWWIPGEYGSQRHTTYIRIFINPGGSGLYDANSEICGKLREAGFPCSNYYSHEGGSVFVAYIL